MTDAAIAPSKPPAATSWLRRILGMRFLVISIAVHLLFGLGAAVWVVQSYVTKRKLTFQAGPPSPNRSTRAMEHKVQMQKKQSSMSAPANKRIVSTGISKVTLPEMPSMPKTASAPSKMAGVGGASVGSVGGPMGAAGAAGGGGVVSMFGLRVQASKLGVILDVSGSTHKLLPLVMRTIQSKFAKIDTVLVVGCGMHDHKAGTDISVKPFGVLVSQDEKLPGDLSVLQQFEKSKVPEIKRLKQQLRGRPNLFAVQGGGIGATQYAFKKLLDEQDVDSIYWFADFADSVNDKVAAEVVAKVKEKKAKVYIHSFAGKPPKEILKTMTEESGGGLTVEVPKD